VSGIAAICMLLAGVAYWAWSVDSSPATASPGTAEPSVAAVIDASVVRVRWNGDAVWLPDHGTESRNEIRLPVSFQRLGAQPVAVRRVRLVVDSAGAMSTWEGLYETDDAPLQPSAPVDGEIRRNRMPFHPFELSELSTFVAKTIDFVAVDRPSPLEQGTHDVELQVQEGMSRQWATVSKASFTVPADFTLIGREPSGVEFYRYNYWQGFPLTHGP
jgi:hypothetical protein